MENNENITQAVETAVAKTNWKKELIDWVVCIVLALVIALVVRTFIFTLVSVDGDSMYPTLKHGDKLFTRIIGYKTPKQGDIIIFNPSISESNRKPNKETAYVKRVIAVEGQVVDITPDGHVSVDGEVLKEDYISEPITRLYDTQFPFTVPEDTVFVLGDNRNRSHDSRQMDVGAVPLENIIGKAEFRLLPFSSFGTLYK